MNWVEDLRGKVVGLHSGASTFLTNDAQLSSIPEIKVLVLKNLKTDS